MIKQVSIMLAILMVGSVLITLAGIWLGVPTFARGVASGVWGSIVAQYFLRTGRI